jgi:hypothetical protein
MFLNTTMLAGIGGAVLPLVLHLLNRARYRKVQWGAMMFLDTGDALQFRSTRIRELALLLLRMGIVAMLAIALARPVLGGGAGAGPGGAIDDQSATVIVLDRSGSMALEENGQQRIDPARRVVLGILAGMRRADQAAIVYTPDWPQHPPLLSADLRSLAAEVGEARPFNGVRADLPSSLTAAARLLRSSTASDKRLVIVCDRQASNWRDVTETFASTWRSSITAMQPAPPRVTVIPVGGSEAGNVAVEMVRVVNAPVIRDTPAEVEVTVTNYDPNARPGLSLVLSLASDREIYRTTLDLGPGASVTRACQVKLPSVGSYVLRATVQGTSDLRFDDAMDCAVEVTEPLPVLLVSGDPVEPGEPDASDAFKGRSAADYLRLALAPFAAAGQNGPDPVQLDPVFASEMPELDRARHAVVVLANVPRFSLQQVRQIEQYVYGGGGLLIAPGSRSQIKDYNAQLWRDGSGLLPAELDPAIAASPPQPTTLLGLELSHPIFRFLRGREDPVPQVSIGRYFPLREIEAGGKVLARYASGKPFLVEAAYGRGRVLLFTTSLDGDWSNLPRSSCYLPLIQSSVRYLASGIVPDPNVLPGEPLLAVIDDSTSPRATMSGPGIREMPIDLIRAGGKYEARITNTARPGTYRLSYPSATGLRNVNFIVRPARDESDPKALTDQQWAALQTRLGFERIDRADADPQALAAAVIDSRQRRHELWPAMLVAVIALGLLELGLTRAWTAAEEVHV